MSLDRFVPQLEEEVRGLDDAGIAKGQERVVTGVECDRTHIQQHALQGRSCWNHELQILQFLGAYDGRCSTGQMLDWSTPDLRFGPQDSGLWNFFLMPWY